MEKIFIAIVVLYALFVGIYFLRVYTGKRRKKNIVGEGSSIYETGRLKADIVGKSKFDITDSTPIISKSEPLTTTSPETEKEVEKPDTFVPTNEVKVSAELPPEELEEAFSDTPPDDEDNEPMDIDIPLEYETGKDDEIDDEEESEEVEGAAQAAIASGVKFEDLGNAVRTVNNAEDATAEEKEAAGNTLMEIRQTDMFEQLVSGEQDRRDVVTMLMSESLSAFYRRKDKEAGNKGSGRKAPENFDIRNFA